MDTSWEIVASWYDKIVGKSGHYFHEEIIFPKLKKLCAFDANSKILDMGSGTGVLANHIPKGASYLGIDASPEMVKKTNAKCLVHDLTKPLILKEKDFTHIIFILSLQNMKDPAQALKNASDHLSDKGSIYLILNHPYFRIPRQTSWGIDEEKKIQYRRIDRYLSPLEIPITMNPGTANSATTFSYHFPLSTYINILGDLNLGITHMEEWISEKVSTGKSAKTENRARSEFPLFLFLIAKRIFKR